MESPSIPESVYPFILYFFTERLFDIMELVPNMRRNNQWEARNVTGNADECFHE